MSITVQKVYPPAFRREAVSAIRTSGKSIRDVANEFGVSYESLREWRMDEQRELDDKLTSDERNGLRRLLRVEALGFKSALRSVKRVRGSAPFERDVRPRNR
jgi:transposase-like protein